MCGGGGGVAVSSWWRCVYMVKINTLPENSTKDPSG